MRAVVQRVSRAAVEVEGQTVGSIGRGLLVLLGVGGEDTERDAVVLAEKVAGLRVFPDGTGRMNRSVGEAGGSVLVVSQFTLLADLRRGRRPSFTGAADPVIAAPLVEAFAAVVAGAGIPVAMGRFGAHMDVDLVNEGPVTIVLDVIRGKLV
jgi:D-tyrosyl-tRNA(Tyr) deacylase